MADLQNLRDSLDKLEQAEKDLTTLAEKKSVLDQECVTLQARKKYLQGEIVQAEKRVKEQEAIRSKSIAEQSVELKIAKNKLQDANKALAEEYGRALQVKQNIAVEQREHKQTIDALQKDLDESRGQLSEIEAKKSRTLDEILDLNTELTDLNDKITKAVSDSVLAVQEAKYKEDIARKQVTEHEEALSTLKMHKIALNKEIEALDAQLSNIRLKSASEAQKRQDFIDYEKRAKKALQARESSLLEREKQANELLRRGKQNGGVLDSV